MSVPTVFSQGVLQTPRWRLRADPLKPCALWLPVAMRSVLLQRLGQLTAERADTLQLEETQQGVLLSGESEQLPWVDGALWLGRDPQALELLLPVLFEPDVPAHLLQQVCLKRTNCQTAVVPTVDEQPISTTTGAAYATLLVPVHAWKLASLWLLHQKGMLQ